MGQVVGVYLPVVRLKQLYHLHVAQPPVLILNTAVGVPPYRRLHMLADIPRHLALLQRLKCRVDVRHKHVPTSHAGVLLLVRVQTVVELPHVTAVVGYQLLPRVVLFVLVGVVLLVKHLLGLCTVVAVLGVEPADAKVVLVLDAPLLSAVHRLGIFLLGVLRGAEPYEGKHHTGFQKAVLPLAHQVVLNLYLSRAAPAVPVQQAEHVAEAVNYQVHILVPVVGHADNALARHVIGVVGFRSCLRVFQLARKVAVVEAHLTQ